jgi:hypothetical protein
LSIEKWDFLFVRLHKVFARKKLKVRHIAQKRAAPGVGGAAKKKRARALLILYSVIAAQTAEVGGSAKQLALLGGDKTLLPKLVHARDGDGVLVLTTEVAASDVEEILGVEDGGGHSGVLRM